MATIIDMALVAMILNALLSDHKLGLLGSDKDGQKRLELHRIALAPFAELPVVQKSWVVRKYNLIAVHKQFKGVGIGHKGHVHNRECQSLYALRNIMESGIDNARNRGRLAAAQQFMVELGVAIPDDVVKVVNAPYHKHDITAKAMSLLSVALTNPQMLDGETRCYVQSPEAHDMVIEVRR